MAIIIDGSNGIINVDGSAAAPASTGQNTDTGIFYGVNTVNLATAGVQRLQIAANGQSTFSGDVVVSGNTTLNGTLSLSANGSFTNFSTSGNTTIGDASGDTLTINAGTTNLVQGTANGVVYLNGSKGLTSNSALTFDGTNLGVGTSSPTRRLEVNSGSAIAVRLTRSGGIVANLSQEWFDGTNSWYAGVSGNNFFGIAYNSSGGAIDSALLRLDSSGNLGLGVTPSAWTNVKALEFGRIGNSVAGNISSATTYVTAGAYYNSSWKYGPTGESVGMYEVGAAHKWFTAPSGNTGNTISFTQVMTLDASGNLGIGTTAPTTISNFVNIDLRGSSGGFVYTGTGASAWSRYGYNGITGAVEFQAFSTAPITLFTNSVERARITSVGEFVLKTGSLQEVKTVVSASDIDVRTGNYFTKTITGTTTFTVSNVPAANTAASFILDLTNGGSATVNWWAGTKWAGGTAPTLTSAGRDVLGFFTHDGGTTWSGLVLGKDVK